MRLRFLLKNLGTMPHEAAVVTPSKRLFKYVDGLSLAIYIVTLEFPDSDGNFLWLEFQQSDYLSTGSFDQSGNR